MNQETFPIFHGMSLEERVELWRDLNSELGDALNYLKALEADIKSEVRETGQIPQVDRVVLTARKPTRRTKWNTKALEGYAAAHPEISQFRETYYTAPAISIKLV